MFPNAMTFSLMLSISDHYAILLELEPGDRNLVDRPFRVDNLWPMDNELESIVKSCWVVNLNSRLYRKA